MDHAEKLVGAKDVGAAELCLPAHCCHLPDAAYVVVMPMRRHDELHSFARIDAKNLQVLQRGRGVRTATGVDQHPGALADVHDDALTVPGTKKGQFKLVVAWGIAPVRHSSNARLVSRAHSLPCCRSRAVTRGRSRNTIWETRFLVHGRRALVADYPAKDSACPQCGRVVIGDLGQRNDRFFLFVRRARRQINQRRHELVATNHQAHVLPILAERETWRLRWRATVSAVHSQRRQHLSQIALHQGRPKDPPFPHRRNHGFRRSCSSDLGSTPSAPPPPPS